MIERADELRTLRRLLRTFRVVGIVGARQVGKTTLARQVVASQRGASHYFDLENPQDLARLADPMLALSPLRGLVVIDEVQRMPGLFPVLRVLSDRTPTRARFLLLGSASPELLQRGSESLAGRIAYHELGGFAVDEVGVSQLNRLWLRGGFPTSFLARSDAASDEWRRQFIRTFLERDLPGIFGSSVRAVTMQRLWSMLAHHHGQTLNLSELARSFGVADTTIRGYVDALTSALVIHQLRPWHENLSKRQVKTPRVFLSDTGLLHSLLGLHSHTQLESHPKVGASWEGFAMSVVTRQLQVRRDECYYWRTHSGAELDLLVVRGRRRVGFEFKRTTAPRITPSMRTAIADLGLSRLDVIYAGTETFALAPKIRAVPLVRAIDDLAPLP